MVHRFRETYHFEKGLEQAVVDLVRVGSTGFASGVRQLATRLVRTVPPGVVDPEEFRSALHDAILRSSNSAGLRFSSGEIPSDENGDNPLVDVNPSPDGAGLILSGESKRQLDEIVEERSQLRKLAQAGVSPTRTVLLSGPPGVGKTMAARWLAETIGVPLVSMDLSSVVSSFLGNSGRNIKSVLNYAKSGPCVLLLDEFDAVAKRREDDTDIGELKRIVNVILVELDRWSDTSLLVAATNHPQLLDPAVHRRFDRRIELALPGPDEREQILAFLAGDSEDRVALRAVGGLTNGFSGSDLARLWSTARRRAVLRGSSTTDELITEVADRTCASGSDRDTLCLMLADRLSMSTRQIAALVGVSHPTVSAAIKRARARS